jgi:hypothetical protein
MRSLWSRVLHLFGVHHMVVVMDDGDTVISRCRWCCASTYGASSSWGEP